MIRVAATDAGALLRVVWVSAVAGVSVAALFSFVVLGSARATEARRAGRDGAATLHATLAVVAFMLFAAGVVLGVRTMLTK